MSIKLEELKESTYVNYFQGLVVSEQHLNGTNRYHTEKRLLTHQLFHGSGIVPGVMNELRVSAHQGGDGLTLEVGSGICLDPQGREIIVPEPKLLSLDLKKYKPPRTIYVVAAHLENQEEHYVNEANPAYQGYQAVRETSKVEIIGQEPESGRQIELARITLQEGKGKGQNIALQDARDFGNPQANEIDLRFTPWCRAASAALSPDLSSHLAFILERTRDSAALLEEEIKIQALRELQLVASTSLIVVSGGQMSFNNLIHLLKPLIRLDQKIVQELQDLEKNTAKKHYTTMEMFEQYKPLAAGLSQALERYNHSVEEFYQIINGHRQGMDLLSRMLTRKRLTWEDVRLLSDDLPQVLLVGETKYKLVDSMEFGSKENLEAHLFTVQGSRDQIPNLQSFTYPDGKAVKDVVMSYRGGNWTWKVRNCLPNKPLVMVRRFDYFHGSLEFEIAVNGKSAGSLLIDGRDTHNRWRNWAFQMNAQLMNSDTVEISQRWIKGQQDGVARLWFYQPVV